MGQGEDPQGAVWTAEYRQRYPVFQKLQEEVQFTVEAVISPTGIRVHGVTSRVKTLESLEEKAQRKLYKEPLRQTPDIVGARIVALYRSDLPRIVAVLHDAFSVIHQEDKVDGAELEEFGYMSHHLEARIPSTHSGPRYAEIKDITFEIQVRTVLMDAWANVSHHLAYKGEETIPPELRRDFHALSGLFYVADKHFELFLDRARDVGTSTREPGRKRLDEIPLSLDTLVGYLERQYPDRRRSSRRAVAELADELQKFGYGDLAALNDMLVKTADRFAKSEKNSPPLGMKGRRYADVGVVRTSLATIDHEYQNYLSGKASAS